AAGDRDRASGRLVALHRRPDADAIGDLEGVARDEEREMGVEVERDLLARLAADAVDGLARVDDPDPGENGRLGHRDALGPDRAVRRRGRTPAPPPRRYR